MGLLCPVSSQPCGFPVPPPCPRSTRSLWPCGGLLPGARINPGSWKRGKLKGSGSREALSTPRPTPPASQLHATAGSGPTLAPAAQTPRVSLGWQQRSWPPPPRRTSCSSPASDGSPVTTETGQLTSPFPPAARAWVSGLHRLGSRTLAPGRGLWLPRIRVQLSSHPGRIKG